MQPGQKVIDLLRLKKEAINVYYARNRCLSGTVEIFPSQRKQNKVNKSTRYDQANHWIAKGKQRRCGHGSKTSVYFCEKCNIGFYQE